MSTIDIRNKHFALEGSTLTLFGKSGFVSGKWWARTSLFGMAEMEPAPVKGKIEKMLNADIEAGNFMKVSHITLDEDWAMCLFLEGALPLKTMEEAEETESEIIFKEVPFATCLGPKIFTVRVAKGAEIATRDENGEVV
jgi:hypothetical protein